MAKQRMVATTIWRKSRKFKQCDSLEKFLFLFLITNEDVDLCGAYEMDLDEMAHQTGIDRRTLPNMLTHLEELKLARYVDGWVVIPNYQRMQSVSNPKVKRGIENSLSRLPATIRDSLSKGFVERSPDLDSDIDSDIDIDSDFDTDTPVPPGPVFAAYRDGIESHLPALAWPDTHKQHKALHEITDKTNALAPDSAIQDPVEFAKAILAAFGHKKRTERGSYWKGAAWEPVVIARRFGELVTAVSDEFERAAGWEAS